MKYIYLVISALISITSFSQEAFTIKPFDAINHTIGGTIKINKAKNHKIEISGDNKVFKYITVNVSNKTLSIVSKKPKVNFDKVIINIFTPYITSLNLESGGNVMMDSEFSTIESFNVTIQNGGNINLSNIAFKNLIATIYSGGIIKYQSADNLISNVNGGGIIKAVKK